MTAAPNVDAILAGSLRPGQAVPVGGGEPVQAKTLVGKAVRCPDCSTDDRQVAAEIVDGGWACHSCGSTGTAAQALGHPGLVFRSGDQAGSPWVIAPDGKVVRYRRPSSFGKLLEDGWLLHRRDRRAQAAGAIAKPTLLLEVERAILDGARIDDLDPNQKDQLDVLVDVMLDAGGALEKAKRGTALHAVAEHVDLGLPIEQAPPVPDGCEQTMAARAQLMAALDVRWLGRERCVINDARRAVGSLDGVGVMTLPDVERVPQHLRGQRVIVRSADDKYGADLSFAEISYAVQQAIYAGSDLYNPATGERVPLRSLAPADETAPWCDDVAVLIHCPATEAKAHLVIVDLARANAWADLAEQVMAARTEARGGLVPAFTVDLTPAPSALEQQREQRAEVDTRTAEPVPVPSSGDPVLDAIAVQPSREALVALWEREAAAGRWDDAAHTDAAKARIALLGAGLVSSAA